MLFALENPCIHQTYFVNGYPHRHKITRAEIIVGVNQNRGKYKFNFPGCVFACVRPELTLLLLNVDQLP